MARLSYSESELSQARQFKGRHFSFFKIETKSGPREIICRNNGQVVGAKVLPLCVSKEVESQISLKGKCSLKKFVREISKAKLQKKLSISLLAIDRPITYLEDIPLNLRTNYLFELPGGVVDHGEKPTQGAIREMLEEMGLMSLCYTRLQKPLAFDSGSNVEWIGYTLALCSGEMEPCKEEGILANKCRTVRLDKFPKFLKNSLNKGVRIDGHVLSAYSQLKLLLKT